MTRITTLNLPDFHKSFLGFDDLVNEFANLETWNTGGYPPYNVETQGEDKYQISVAVAGFKKDEIEITLKDGLLTVEGKKAEKENDGVNYLHRGISSRAFTRSWRLAEYVEVKDAKMEDGLLYVSLEREVPEEKKPKTIAIK